MRRASVFLAACLLVAASSAYADTVEKFTTLGVDGCKDWMILHDDELGCKTFWRNCGEKAYHADPCGWEDCSSIVIGGQPTNWISYPFATTPDHGIIYGVVPGTGGHFVPEGPQASCGGYSAWAFEADGSSAVTMSPVMAQFPPGIH